MYWWTDAGVPKWMTCLMSGQLYAHSLVLCSLAAPTEKMKLEMNHPYKEGDQHDCLLRITMLKRLNK